MTDIEILANEVLNMRSLQIKYSELMHHCVFKMGYYKHDHTLLLSARKAGKRLETIELNTESWKVVQSRGLQNQRTKDHDKILDLLKANMNKLQRCVNA